MATIGYAGLPVPAGSNAPDISAILATYTEALDPHLLQLVADEAERDVNLTDAPAGTVAVSTTDGSVWAKTAAGWVTWWEPVEAWRPISLNSGFSEFITTPQVRRIGSQVFMRGRIQNEGTVTVPVGVAMGVVPTDCIPSQLTSLPVAASYVGDPSTGVGRLDIYSPEEVSQPEGSITWNSQDGDGAVTWVELTGSYWID